MKCIPGDIVYFSIPEQYRCKKCLRYWFVNKKIPECIDYKKIPKKDYCTYHSNKCLHIKEI